MKEQIFIISSNGPSKWIDKEVWEKTMKKINEDLKKNYKTTDGVWYVKK